MKIKRTLALLLSLLLCLAALTACGNTEQGATPPASDTSQGDQSADAPDGEVDDESDVDTDEMKTIVVELFRTTTTDTATEERLTAAMNEITEELINVHVDLNFNSPTDIATKVSVGIPAGDQMDLMCFNPVGGCTLGTLVAQNQVIDMTAYLEEYAPQTLELLEDYLPATTFDGQIMGVTNLRQLNESFWLTMNADVLEELGLTEKAEACDDWTTYAEIM